MISNIRLRNYGPFSDVEFDLEKKKGEPNAVALVYGENGAGKTKLIDSVEFLKETAHTHIGPQRAMALAAEREDIGTGRGEIGEALSALLSVLSKNAAQSSREANLQRTVCGRMTPDSDGMSATYGFILDGKRFSYCMEFDSGGKLIGESLDGPISSRAGNIYTIRSSGNGPDIRLSPSFLKDDGFRKEMIGTIERYWGNDTFLGILNEQYILCNESFMGRNVLGSFDRFRRYVDSITVFPSQEECDLCEGVIDVSDSERLDAAESAYNAFFKSIDGNIKGVRYRREESENGIRYHLVFDRRISGRIVGIDYEDESDGYRQLARMLPVISKMEGGDTVLIDGFDSGIHEMMVWKLMERIRACDEGQLIATTHDTELLDDFEPSSAYVIQVDRNGFRKILPLNRIARTQRTNSVRSQYLRGCFEGIPYIGDVDLEDISSRFEGKKIRR